MSFERKKKVAIENNMLKRFIKKEKR